jgi:hypothetical protein
MGVACSVGAYRSCWFQRPWRRNTSAMNTYAQRLAMEGEIKDHAVVPLSQHLSQALGDPDPWCAHPSVIVVPTVPMTNASGNRAAICWHAFQPVQCAGTSSDGESSASASSVGPMIGSNIGPLR